MKTVITALALALLASTATAGDPRHAPRVYTFELTLDAAGRVEQARPHGAGGDAIARDLQQRVGELLFDAGAGATTTFLRILATHDGPRADDYTVVSATTGPAPVELTRPAFPEDDMAAGHEGAVVLRLDVRPDGSVADPRVESTVGDISRPMAAAALQAASGWRFAPERVNGQPVASTVLLSVCYLAAESDASTCTWRGPNAERFTSRSIVAVQPAARLVSGLEPSR